MTGIWTQVLTVVSHDSSVGEQMYLTVCPPHGPNSILGHGVVFWRISLTDFTLPARPDPAWKKMAQCPLNDTTQPVGI